MDRTKKNNIIVVRRQWFESESEPLCGSASSFSQINETSAWHHYVFWALRVAILSLFAAFILPPPCLADSRPFQRHAPPMPLVIASWWIMTKSNEKEQPYCLCCCTPWRRGVTSAQTLITQTFKNRPVTAYILDGASFMRLFPLPAWCISHFL